MGTKLFYDERDRALHEGRRSRVLLWLEELGALPLCKATPKDWGFVFAGARPLGDYRQLVAHFPYLRDRPEERAPLLRLDSVLHTLQVSDVNVATPKTWRLALDAPLPRDLAYPLFLRTAQSSLKLGGQVSRVRNEKELESEARELRRLLGWNALILAREWCDFAEAGKGVYGPIPQEVRVWIVDGMPFTWSFHYLSLLLAPKGFPPSDADLAVLSAMAAQIGSAFQSRCVVADFAKKKSGGWVFIEAGPGSCAGSAHEAVFKAVATRLRGEEVSPYTDGNGGVFPSLKERIEKAERDLQANKGVHWGKVRNDV